MTNIMATMVGVRDLKLHAPRLVERAARGERIVITRYGHPRASLGPVRDTGDAAVEPTGRAAEWGAERAAFERLQPAIEKKYRGRWVAIVNGRVADAGADHGALYERVWKKHGGRAFFIGRVGTPPPVVEMTGFETE